jgi:DNA end-binding protein Ku
MSAAKTADHLLPPGAAPPPAATRPSWSGLLQLSLVGIPLKAYPAVRSREVSHFHQLHAGCGQRIRYAKHCPVHGPVDLAAIVKGYEYGPGQHLVLEPEELDPLRPAQDRALRLERFVEAGKLDLLLLSGRSLHLLPDGVAAEHPYDVLRAVMVQQRRWAVGRMVLGGHRQIVAVAPAGAVLIAHVLHFPEHVRVCPRSANGRAHGSAELSLAGQLIDAASGAIDWSAYRDESAEELRALVERKMQGQTDSDAATAPTVLPFLQALQQSVAAVAPPVAADAPQSKAPAPRPRKRRA